MPIGFDEYLAETLNNPSYWERQRIGSLVVPPSVTAGGDLVAVAILGSAVLLDLAIRNENKVAPNADWCSRLVVALL